MYSPSCLFCVGMCGARAKRGSGCRWPANECPVAKHAIYREYTEHQLADFAEARALEGHVREQPSARRPRRHPYRRVWADIKDSDGQPLAQTPVEPYL
jgi:hypothetical protein